jgi:S-adenosylmethionine:tRNA ribosyltransferase-isomerase
VRIDFGGIAATVVTEPDAGRIVVHSEADLGAVAEELGEIPLPPYFHGSLADEERYQTVFADRLGSAAAPTAALHFTDRVVGGLEAGGVEVARVELEVGLDTFRPITAGLIEDHRMHSERIVVGEEVVSAITRTRAAGGRVVAIGTTVVRTLESAARSGELRPFVGATDLFITPGFEFKVVDLVVTNFHVPGSTLIVLVASLMGPRWHDVYQTALERGYRFLSFGDAMLVEVAR